MTGREQRRSGTRGQTLIETAFIGSLFFLLLFAGFEFSRMILVYTTVSNAARAGARAAIVNGSLSGGGADIEGIVKAYAAAATLKRDNVAVVVAYSPNNQPGSKVTVTVSYPYDAFTFVPVGAVTLSASSQGVVTF
jgi:Flp pilus assembly protein TadG